MAAQASLCLAWLETPEDTFCRVVAHIVFSLEDMKETKCCVSKVPEYIIEIFSVHIWMDNATTILCKI